MMRSNISTTITVDFEQDEFLLSPAWTIHRPVSTGTNGHDAFTQTDRNVLDFDLEQRGSDVFISHVTVKVKMDRSKTWVVTSKKSNWLLMHEQGHYYIAYLVTVTELCPKILALKLPATSMPKPDSLQDNSNKRLFVNTVNGLVRTSSTRVKSLNDAYDDTKANGGTDHGTEHDMQVTWSQKFMAALTSGKPLP